VNDGCSLVDEWKSEIDMATAMVNEAKASFAKYARQDGGLPVDVIEQFAQGRGVMLDGKPIVDGAFIRVDGGFGVVTDGGMLVTAWRDGRHFQTRPANYRNKFEVILPGSTDYDAMLTEAAKLEDDMARNGVALTANDAKLLYSSLVPAVSQRRTIASLVLCDAGATGLPAPQFPVVLDPELAKVGPVLAAIVEPRPEIRMTRFFMSALTHVPARRQNSTPGKSVAPGCPGKRLQQTNGPGTAHPAHERPSGPQPERQA
jgi:hypothetical protein